MAETAEALWCARVEAGTDDWLVLPDGCLDVVLVEGEEAHVVGPATVPSVHAAPQTSVTVGVRLRPGAAAVLGVAAWELRDARVPLATLVRGGAPKAAELLAGGDPAAALRALAVALPAQASRRRDPLVERAAAALRDAPARTVTALTDDLAISPRQLRRRFDEHVGYGPKRFARHARLQHVLALHRARPDATLAALAARAGYADQAHLATDARALAGTTASALLAQRAGVRNTSAT